MKVAIIGLGGISAVHSKILLEQGHEIVAVCDIDPLRFTAFPNSKQYTDYLQMLDEVELDGVHICTPHYLHAEMIIACLRRNINVLCEKPLCINEEEGKRILAAERASSAILGVAHQNRYNATSLFVKKYLEKNPPRAAFATVVWLRGEEYYASAAWRGKYATEGGGVLINQALHTLDLVQWFVGMPQKVCAVAPSLKLKGIIEVEDTVCASFTGQTPFQFFASNCAATDFPIEITIQTEKDLIRTYADKVSVNEEWVALDEEIKQKGDWLERGTEQKNYGKKCYGGGHVSLIADFYDCIEKNERFSIDGAEGLKVIKLIQATYKSNGVELEIGK